MSKQTPKTRLVSACMLACQMQIRIVTTATILHQKHAQKRQISIIIKVDGGL